MKSFFSIISASSSLASNEMIAIGIIIFDGQRYHFKKSFDKIDIASKLLFSKKKNFEWAINQIQNGIQSVNIESKKVQSRNDEERLFEFKSSPQITSSFFEYLSKYSNGILNISPPKELRFKLRDSDLTKLFHLYVDPEREPEKIIEVPNRKYSPEEFKQKIDAAIVLPLHNKINTKFVLKRSKTPKIYDEYPEIYFDLELDCIGKNGSIYAAKAFDFENVSARIHDRQIAHYHIFSTTINRHSYQRKNKFFLIGDEPSDLDSEVYHQWAAVKEMPHIEVVALNEAEMVREKIEKSGAGRFYNS